MLSVEHASELLKIHRVDIFFRARKEWRPEANPINDYHNYVMTGVIPSYVAAFLDCEERKQGGH